MKTDRQGLAETSGNVKRRIMDAVCVVMNSSYGKVRILCKMMSIEDSNSNILQNVQPFAQKCGLFDIH